MSDQNKFVGNVLIRCVVTARSGLSVFSGDDPVEIGNLDKRIMRLLTTIGQIPYIPGSTWKGCLRFCAEMLDNAYYNTDFYKHQGDVGYHHVCQSPECFTCRLFGAAAGRRSPCFGALKVMESYLRWRSLVDYNEEFPRNYGEIKYENTICRITGQAKPRQFERVPALSEFSFGAILTISRLDDENDDVELLKRLFSAMLKLEDNCVGASKSRGYGLVTFGKYPLDSEEEKLELLSNPFDADPVKGLSLEVRGKKFYRGESGENEEINVLVRKPEGDSNEHLSWNGAIEEIRKKLKEQ